LPKCPASAARAVIDLSGLIRFAVNSSHINQQPFRIEEILQLESLIRIYKLRFKERVLVEFTHSKAAREYRLIPLMLLTLAKNLFKHGNIHKKQDPAKIDIAMNGFTLTISTYNLQKDGELPQGFHGGLVNILTRLEYNYPYRFKIE